MSSHRAAREGADCRGARHAWGAQEMKFCWDFLGDFLGEFMATFAAISMDMDTNWVIVATYSGYKTIMLITGK